MSKHLDGFAEYMRRSKEMALAQTNERHRDILLNYNRHAALEFSDRWQEIFTPEMTNDHPHYVVRLGTEEIQDFDGTDSVKGFYSLLNESVVWLQDEELFVNDWGLASRSTFGQFISGADAKAAGYEVDDEEATYMLSCPLAMFWPYDEKAKLIGEEVWELTNLQISKPDPEDVFTFEERKKVLEPYL